MSFLRLLNKRFFGFDLLFSLLCLLCFGSSCSLRKSLVRVLGSTFLFVCSFAGCQGNDGCAARPAPVVPASETADGGCGADLCRPSFAVAQARGE